MMIMIKKEYQLIWVEKADGSREYYSPQKIVQSSIRAGASEEEAEKIRDEINKIVYNGITTKEIYTTIIRLLKRIDTTKASIYCLKEALMNLGPSGFPFEAFIGKILESQEYNIKLRSIMKGQCVNHEIDIIADRDEDESNQRSMIECKYHNYKGIYTGLKEALYTYARFRDLTIGHKLGFCEKFDNAWLVTNTRFSSDAIAYAKCKKLKLLGWNYPPEAALEVLIDKKKFYPITILRSLDNKSKASLANADLIVLNDLTAISLETLHKKTSVSKKKLSQIKNEAEEIINSPK